MGKKKSELEYDYFKARTPRRIYVSKAFRSFKFKGRIVTTEQRYIKKVFEKDTGFEFVESVNAKGEITLRNYNVLGKQIQVNAVVYSHQDTNLMEFTLQKFVENEDNTITPIKETSFTFNQKEFAALLKFLSDLKFLDFSYKERFVVEEKDLISSEKILINLTNPDPNKILVDKGFGDIIKQLEHLNSNERKALIDTLKNNILTKEDLDILSGRKDGLEEFQKNLNKPYAYNEIDWQKFFNENSWIFGYGLDYKFLNIIQKEASVSGVDIDSKNEVKSDFLLGDNNFTVIVELKRPDTFLFEKDKNRSESWQLSKDLTYAVSQILTQKAEWELNAEKKRYDNKGQPITQATIDPKAILIIGHTEQFQGDTKENIIKKKTFELYRRNLRNIDIVTYDELLARALFIVNNNNKELISNIDKVEDFPF